MNIKIQISIALLGVFILYACQKEPEPKPLPEAGYPYIYKRLSSSEWEGRNAVFQETNIYEGLDLNEYGFVEGEILLNENDSLTEEFVTETLESIIEKYKSFLGIPNTMSIDYRKDFMISAPLLIPGGSYSIEYYFQMMEELKKEDFWPEIKNEFVIQSYFLRQNLIGNKSFAGPGINFIFYTEENRLTISGNWFPDVYIPSKNIFTIDDATAIIYRSVLKETGRDMWERKNVFNPSKTFIYLEKLYGTEIRECWSSRVPINDEYYYYIYIDTQTGDIIRSYKRGMYYL